MGLRTFLGLKKTSRRRQPKPQPANETHFIGDLSPDGRLEPEVAAWFQGKEFTTDWVTDKIDLWLPIFREIKQRPLAILEAGSYEGRSAIAFLEGLPGSSITCIDHFKKCRC